jgi:hypothetical protein
MCKTKNPGCRPATTQEFLFSTGGTRCFGLLLVVLMLILASVAARAQEVDDQYVQVLTLVQQGDALKTAGDNTAALAKYRAAQDALKVFRKDHPDWNTKVVGYRSNSIVAKIAEITGETIPGTGAPAPGSTGSAQTGSKTSTATSGQTVKLLEAGAEPRKVLRLHPKPGDKQTVLMTMKMGMEMQMGETQAPAVKLPPMVLTMEATIKDVSPDGDISFDTVISDASVGDEPGAMPQVAEAMKTAMGGVKGLTGKGITSSRGVNKKTEMQKPAGADAQMVQVMDQMKDTFANLSTPFPEEAVGAGAKWELRKTVKSQGMTISQIETYQLASLEGDRLSAKATVTQSAANQKIQNPAMAGVKMDLTKMTGKGGGELTLDLAQAMPSAGNLDMHSEMAMSMNTGGQKSAMNMKMDINVKLESK